LRSTAKTKRRLGVGRIVTLLVAITAAWAIFTWLRLPDAAALKTANPKTTSLMDGRAHEAREKGLPVRHRQVWVPLSAIAKTAVAAVLISEDAAFYQHSGVDTVELHKAMEQAIARHHLGRGASTITQQLAKNLWLSTDRSLLRKLKELLLAKRLEANLTKSRILNLYLNVVEWGDGVYGIEAASLEHFGVHANALSPAQGAMLASMLPAPRKRLPRLKPVALHRHALLILDRLEAVGRLEPGDADEARQELERFFGKAETPGEEPPLAEEDEADPGS
jgi:monofunctional biosynthetic peptidoglycan transglycosylase